jgi:hypothetical protein
LTIDISGDGSTLAIGSDISIWALKWNGTHYKQHLNNLPSGDASAISLSRDGNAMAVGIPSSRGGVTTVYKVRPQGCTGNKKLLHISFTTDNRPEQNRWALHIGNETIESQPYDGLPLMTFVKEICVPNNVCVKFRVFDSGGDGIQDPGGYSVMLDGEEVANGGDFSYGESKYITGDCDCPAGLTLLSIVAQNGELSNMEWALSHQNSTLAEEYVFIRTMGHTVEIFEECIPEGCWHLSNPQCHAADAYYNNDDNVYGFDWSYNITYKGWSKANGGDANFCPEGNETISFGECLPGENIEVDYRTIAPTTLSPSSSSSPTLCTGSTPDWVDGEGDGCDWYEINEQNYGLGCEEFGARSPAKDGSTANESCCHCFLSNNPMPTFNPTYSPTISISPSSSSSPSSSCTGNTPDWVDGDGDGCDWYERNDVLGCEEHGEEYAAEDGSTAKDNCCYCFLSNNPMPSPTNIISISPTGTTLPTKPPTKPSIVTKFDELTTENNEDGMN